MTSECYILYRDDILKNNLKTEDDSNYVFYFPQINIDVYANKRLIEKNKELYLHATRSSDNNYITQAFIESSRRWEFKLIEIQKELKMKEKSLLEGHKIKKVVFRTIDPIALEAALEKLELGEDVQLKNKGDHTYLVSAGKSLKITGEDFQKYLSTFLIGKYVEDIQNPSTKKRRIMKELIVKLGIVKGFETEIEDEGLEAFFG